jgi:protein Tex
VKKPFIPDATKAESGLAQFRQRGRHGTLRPLLGLLATLRTRLLAGRACSGFAGQRFGLPTVTDIVSELEKPGRDPRPEFKTAVFREGVDDIKDLEPGMVLEGVVTNVTNFGAFVDVGVHQDGLVHISALADKFVKDPHTVVKAGAVVKVKVLEVDPKRRRIALTMRLSDQPGESATSAPRQQARPQRREQPEQRPQGAMAAALAKLRKA